MRTYLYKAKRLSEQLIKENSQLKDEIEEEYYKLLIKVAKEEFWSRYRNYFKLKDLKNKTIKFLSKVFENITDSVYFFDCRNFYTLYEIII